MNTEPIPTGDSFGPLSPHVNSYLHQVRAQGYAIGSLYEQVCALRLFGHWLKRTGRGLRDIDEGVTRHFLRHVIKRRYPKNAAPATLRRLLRMLRRVGVTPEPKAARSTPCAQVTAAYERFLTEERNLAPETVHRLRRTADRFVSEQFGGGALKLSKLRAADVTAFVQRHAHRHGPFYVRPLVTGTRSFLRYLHYKGLVQSDLSSAVPKVARWSLASLPKHLPAAQVQEMLRRCDRGTPLGRRDYAILLVLARLGLRAGEVLRLNLEDLDWDHGRITVCGKGKQAQLPLPADVARAIAQYPASSLGPPTLH